jgi:myo-inositol 2-dehydrogenase/D-chiro-inositol 1-dehydrogenase
MNEHETAKINSSVSRRHFIQGTSVGLAGLAATAKLPLVHAASEGPDFEIKIGLIGCGGRGTGAVLNAVGAATDVIYPQSGYHTEDVAKGAKVERPGIKVVALADLFEDRWGRCQGQLKKLGIEVPDEMCFTGFDAYKQLLAVPEINYVILTTPPHFRPQHLMAAMEAGKHAFIEKPAAVGIAAGTQRRHMKSYQETIQRIHDGAIGDIVYAKCYWNGGQIWVIDRQPGWSDMEWQLRNWNYFTWLSGDHIVEQHVHNLDVMNWVLGTHPTRAVSGLGGRQVRVGECRQINGCLNKVEEDVIGCTGRSNCKDRIQMNDGESWRYRERGTNPYQQEHEDLIASIRNGNPINEAQAVAEGTLTGIMGREAVYSGREVTWEDALASTMRLGPDQYQFGPYPIPPIRMPGTYRFS